MKFKMVSVFVVLFVMILTGACAQQNLPLQNQATPSVHEDLNGYWTCSMHPEIHQHEKGKCPICAMDLIHVEK